ncbi:MAG: hypothetical protein COV07_03120 [Candidatus Vogelbacteria bacterium CG10_big_fil_rev_8_21_14_0_10_45_14]|uniref:RNA polymerase subunit sigma-24 n=1 Tax=Candidatus Vogelbacteria bacterium CG10_big_fil_rev_8_21_14_0_10_45_14 TaxID=1975042 RepID=A0A2H0RJG4_9BACT|nr:MAG: hypothetical protein COV07_03120 [Candidatus Vogelbacteria bacterium CG10_big_fil_rev_8_21_14_0_10_45_14]
MENNKDKHTISKEINSYASAGFLEVVGGCDKMEDEAILTLSFDNPDYFAELVRRYEAPFLRRAERILHDRIAAEDVVQDTFTKIYIHGRSFKKQAGASFKSWAYRILFTTSLSRYRREQRIKGGRIDVEPEIAELIAEEGVVDLYEAKERVDLVDRILQKLPTPLARALELAYREELSGEEIAEQEGISHEAVRARIHRAKKKFREELNDEGKG